MSKKLVITELENLGTAHRANRERVRNFIFDNPDLLPHLIDIVFEVDNKLSIKAAWVLELVCEKHLIWLLPYINIFTSNIHRAYLDSAVRPLSKICNFIAKEYNKKTDNPIKKNLSKKHIDKIIETGFDWMISNHKVAVKAYTMNALYIFGKNSDWVHNELKLILLQNIPKETSAYKSRGKITVDLINKK
ncbi:hypothetical protein SAMN05444411_11044 [Lutibacter oricola]|uniref:Adenylosuccinate lyase n=1 Tax=Lutibacter oricola TaxID=762486 RepID=A0A1H3EWB1_9FLAO|nr:hypothetical protein [Lutibacter oricola]SDX83051.1 hypothetical protein SAMN05444411_11044 [Lutibacter oricola]